MNCIKGFKFLILALCLLLVLSFSACRKNNSDNYSALDNDTTVSDTEGGDTTHSVDLPEDVFETPDSENSDKDAANTPSTEVNGASSENADSKDNSSKDANSLDSESKKEDGDITSSKNNVGEITEDGKIKLPTVWFD